MIERPYLVMLYLGCYICPTITENESHNNTVVVQQEEMDRVGVEPTTSVSKGSISSSYRFCMNKNLFEPHLVHYTGVTLGFEET